MSNTTSNGSLQREVTLPPAAVTLLKAMGLDLPPNLKEIETDVEFSDGTQKILLPRGMDKLIASKELAAQWKNEEQKIDFSATFEGWNWQDVLVAIKRVTEREFGWMNAQANWFTGNPKELDVVTDIVKGKKINEKALDRKSTRLNSSHYSRSRMPSSA